VKVDHGPGSAADVSHRTRWFPMLHALRRTGVLVALTAALLTGLVTLTSTSAQAAWTTLGQSGAQVKYLICKTAVDSGYGPLWKVTLVMATSPNYSGSATFRALRGGQIAGTNVLSARQGAWDVQTAYLSRYWGDKYQTSFGAGQISTGYGLGYSMTGAQSMSTVGYC